MNNTIDNVYNNYPLLNIHINIYIYIIQFRNTSLDESKFNVNSKTIQKQKFIESRCFLNFDKHYSWYLTVIFNCIQFFLEHFSKQNA